MYNYVITLNVIEIVSHMIDCRLFIFVISQCVFSFGLSDTTIRHDSVQRVQHSGQEFNTLVDVVI